MEQEVTRERILSIMEQVDGKVIVNEGIDIDYDNLVVSYNPLHQNNVDTSLENSPTVSSEYVEGINVYSIFKRKQGAPFDGNPLLYAFKGEKNWRFKTPNDKEAIVNQIKLVAKKFNSIHQAGFTILIPTSNSLNQFIGNIIKESNDNITIVDNLFLKLTTEEIMDIVMETNSPFMQYYKGKMESALMQLKGYLDKMDKEKEGYFTRHYVVDNTMRSVLNQTIKLSDEYSAKYAKYINDQDILLIDDSISRGQTIKEACQSINDTFNPRTITVLTLFSRLYK